MNKLERNIVVGCIVAGASVASFVVVECGPRSGGRVVDSQTSE